MPLNLSNCCKATYTVKGDDGEGTHWNFCDKCKQDCDVDFSKKKKQPSKKQIQKDHFIEQ